MRRLHGRIAAAQNVYVHALIGGKSRENLAF
jgi:hypothetical protein